MNNQPYANPVRNCDVVMKGGITSGVVYPLAICELAKTYQFKSIGGTSAGAIAAAAAAAAELGRRSPDGGFGLFAELPGHLGGASPDGVNTNLFAFFQPQAATRPLFQTLVAGHGGGWAAPLRVLWAACRAFPLPLLLGTLPGLLLLAVNWRDQPPVSFGLTLLLGVAFAAGSGLLGLVIAFGVKLSCEVPRNFFGLCTGMEGAGADGGEPLTPWLHGYFNRLAGRDPEGPPLTFRDLWGAQADDSAAPRDINLEMMTTCLTHGRPYRLPFPDDDLRGRDNRKFYFREEEFRRLFPAAVVDWLMAHPRPLSEDEPERSRERRERFAQLGFRPLPAPADLPVIVAVRMSLSFPVLLSAVPLHAVDVSRRQPEESRVPERCWFSDGGISSNFPLHFFDSPVPRWPTFGINLSEKHPDHPAGVYFPGNNSAGRQEWWNRFDEGGGLGAVLRFVLAIVATAKDWANHTQARLPGYRDRIAHVSLTEVEGGLNLNMPPERITELAERGRQVGEGFVRRFAGPPSAEFPLNWENHRWVRLRATLAALEETLLRLERGCANPVGADVPYDQLIANSGQSDPPSYDWTNAAQRARAQQLLAQLRATGQALAAVSAGDSLAKKSPSPRPELSVRPRI